MKGKNMKNETTIHGLLELIENCFPANPYPKGIFTIKKTVMDTIKENVTTCSNINNYYIVRKHEDGTYKATCMGRMAFGFETKADALIWCIGVFQDYLIILD
jgi:hypothetical protein